MHVRASAGWVSGSDGDRHLVSPMHYEGVKHFGDFDDSPENTLVSGWHFVKFGIRGEIEVVKK